MSYATMDHAGWAQENIRIHKSIALKKRDTRRSSRKGFRGAPETLNLFQKTVIDILGIVGGGIYNAPISWDGIEWSSTYMFVPWRGELASYDMNKLTMLVFLCHEARIRVSISAHTFRHIALIFHPRSAGKTELTARHPDMQEHVRSLRKYLPEDAPVFHHRDGDAAVKEHAA